MEDTIKVVLRHINELSKKQGHLLIAIDGRCGSGKTTLARCIEENLDCNTIQMDHFFLRPGQRTIERLNEPGGNIDYERFLTDVLRPLKQNISFSYTPFDCEIFKMSEPVYVSQKSINIIEGVYSCHPEFSPYYDLRIFLDIDKEQQAKRIIKRNGEKAYGIFRDKWIPLEELYFETLKIKESCDIYFTL